MHTNKNDWYIHNRTTTTGKTLYEPMLRIQDPDTAMTTAQFETEAEAEFWIALETDCPYAYYRSTNPASLEPADIFIGFLNIDGVRNTMQQHGLRFSELWDHIRDLKAGYTVTAEDGHEWRLAS